MYVMFAYTLQSHVACDLLFANNWPTPPMKNKSRSRLVPGMTQIMQELLVVCVTNQQVVCSKCGHSKVFIKVNSLKIVTKYCRNLNAR